MLVVLSVVYGGYLLFMLNLVCRVCVCLELRLEAMIVSGVVVYS